MGSRPIAARGQGHPLERAFLVVARLADAALGAAIQTRLPAAKALRLVDLKVNYLRPLATDGRKAIAQGPQQHAGRRIAVASSEVTDAAGKPVALATGSAMSCADARRPSPCSPTETW